MSGSNKTVTDKFLILDLDETLLHTFQYEEDLTKLDNLSSPSQGDIRSRLYTIGLQDAVTDRGVGDYVEMWGIRRHYLEEFLKFSREYFKEVIVWTAGRRDYADNIVNSIFRGLTRPRVIYHYGDCVEMEYRGDRYWTKPISKMIDREQRLADLGISLENTFIIDDRLTTFLPNPKNGIQIPAYCPKPTEKSIRKEDNNLIKVANWFMRPDVINSKDVRDLRKNFIFDNNDIEYDLNTLIKNYIVQGKENSDEEPNSPSNESNVKIVPSSVTNSISNYVPNYVPRTDVTKNSTFRGLTINGIM